jgi:8-oxo-dGTP diphosphatase
MYQFSASGVSERGGRFFVARRKPGSSIGKRWEFPGGKAENRESPEEALKREFLEEFNVAVIIRKPLCEGTFSNRGQQYKLKAFLVDFKGEPMAQEHQETRWVTLEELNRLDFPDSDAIIVEALNLAYKNEM